MDNFTFTRKDFPQGFLFGSATSSYQIEGHQFGGAGPTHWDSFAATPGNVVRAENGALACDHYHRFEEDFDLAAAAGLDCYRFSSSSRAGSPAGCSLRSCSGMRAIRALAAPMRPSASRPRNG